ncbi:uncharacterized protein LOC127738502 [Mytilus californianus]|uniref:uncharacterized protein LOC127738502 n=1 Tax=Mytilus californianus TaxID=6549 RepID=UPI002246B3FF|nr:uncharacterized protein LOC127738502 [Mytilus californianus]
MYLFMWLFLVGKVKSTTTPSSVSYDTVEESYELISEDLLRVHSSSDVSYHSLWNKVGFNGHDTDDNRRREIIDDWNELRPLTINMYFCTSGYPNCDENEYILAISIDVIQTSLVGNISNWDGIQCKADYNSKITDDSCSFIGDTINIVNRQIEISKNQDRQFNIVEQGGNPISANHLFVVGVYNETVCACDCVYFDKMEMFKNQTREKKSMEKLKEEMAPELAEMKKNLTVDPKTMSSFLNTKVSKGDERKSSKQIGVLGIVFLTIEVCALVLADLISFRQHWAMIRDNWNGFLARF